MICDSVQTVEEAIVNDLEKQGKKDTCCEEQFKFLAEPEVLKDEALENEEL
jgi:hypothetical protein